MIGQTVSHYRIVEALGSGGMGQVYKAEDLKLGRFVALKFLPPEVARDPVALQRFEREARAASALNHPNICTIYEIDDSGPPFIAMELLEGRSLRQFMGAEPRTVQDVLSIASQAADALDAAHGKGIVHRDIKPENVVVNDRRHVKLLDFGLAKMPLGAATDTATVISAGPEQTMLVTSAGTVQGTVAYMSPEQARGETLDGRSDLFSLGVVLYEMAAGARPFTGITAAVTFDAILNRDPPPISGQPDLPEGLRLVILRLLAKKPEDRYQTARALLDDVRQLQQDVTTTTLEALRTAKVSAALPRPARRWALMAAGVAFVAATTWAVMSWLPRGPRVASSIAVLPFATADTSADARFAADGVATGIMNALTRLPELRVVPRATAFHYRSDAVDLKQVGQDLGVAAVVTGRIRQAGGRLIVQVELTDVATQSLVWGDQFDRTVNQLVDIPHEISARLAEHLNLSLTDADLQRLARRPTNSSEAYKLYLQGRSLWDQWTETSLQGSLTYFEQATKVDPSYALAYFGMAESYFALAWLSEPPRLAVPKARENVMKALAIDDSLPEGHYMLGLIELFHNWNPKLAEPHLKRALDLNPRSPESQFGYGNYLIATGRIKEGTPYVEKAVELDPYSATWNEQLAVLYSELGDLVRAEQQARKTLTLDPGSFWAHFDLGMILLRRGRPAAALPEFQTSADLARDQPYALGYLGLGLAAAGRPDEARAVLERLDQLTQTRHVPSYPRALVYAGLRDDDRTFAMLERARDERDPWLFWYFILDGAFDHLKKDPRYAALVKPLR